MVYRAFLSPEYGFGWPVWGLICCVDWSVCPYDPSAGGPSAGGPSAGGSSEVRLTRLCSGILKANEFYREKAKKIYEINYFY